MVAAAAQWLWVMQVATMHPQLLDTCEGLALQTNSQAQVCRPINMPTNTNAVHMLHPLAPFTTRLPKPVLKAASQPLMLFSAGVLQLVPP